MGSSKPSSRNDEPEPEKAKELIAENKRTKATSLDLNDCGLTTLPAEVGEMVWLRKLHLSNNHELVDVTPLVGLPDLQELNLAWTQVSNLAPLAGLKALQHLDAWGMRVSDLAPLAGLTALQALIVPETEITDLAPLADLKALQYLHVFNTQVSDLTPLADLKALQQLLAWETHVSDLAPLAGLTALQTLDVHNTQISDLTPLARLTALQTLDIHNTQISDVTPLGRLVALQKLDFSFTQVTDLSPLTPLFRRGIPVRWSTPEMNDEAGVYVGGCPLVNPAPEIVKQGNEAILNHFAKPPSFTVFVCSTFSDLSQEREGVLDAIRRLKLQHDAMEFFGAHAEQPIETCLQEVRASDVLVVIVGHRYGSIVPDLGISYSEAEYTEGFRLKKPCLVYMRDDNVPVLPKHMERDPEKLKLLERWKVTIQSRHTVATFQDGGRLAVQVAGDLARTIQDLEEVAKARAAGRAEGGTALLTEVTNVVTDALGQGVPEASLLSAIRSSVSSLLGTIQKREPTVFLSYSRKDSNLVRRFGDGLAAAGVGVWRDDVSLKAGADWMQEVERELSAADFFVFFISQNSVRSEWVARELQVALHRQVSGEGGAVILPVLVEDADVPPLLRQFQWIDARGGNVEMGVGQLVDAIAHWSAKRSV